MTHVPLSVCLNTMHVVVDLLPGVSVDIAVAHIKAADSELGNVRGGAFTELDSLNAFRAWSATQARQLAYIVTPESLTDLILTAGYDRLVLLSPAAYGTGLRTLVDIEVDAAERRLREAAASLERQQQRWQDWRYGRAGKPHRVVVLDTNVLLRHADRLNQIDWHGPVRAFFNEPVVLGIPMVVISELDDLKTTTAKMEVDTVEVQTRARVRVAHKMLDAWFAGNHVEHVLHRPTAQMPDLGELSVKLMIDDLRHGRLPTADAEIIDRTLALIPFTDGVALATGDRAMRIQARFEGLESFDPQLRDAPSAAASQ